MYMYVCMYVYMFRMSYRKSPPALILRFLRHSLIQKKLFTNYSVSEKTLTIVPPQWKQQGWRPLVDLPIQLERYGLPHGKKVSSVDAMFALLL